MTDHHHRPSERNDGMDREDMLETDARLTFLQLPTASVVERGEHGQAVLRSLLTCLRETHLIAQRRQLYLDKAAQVGSSACFEIEGSTSETALQQLGALLGQDAKVQARYTDELQDRVVRPLEAFLAHNASELMHHKAQLREVADKVKAHGDALARAKRDLSKASDEARAENDKLLQLAEIADEAERLSEEKRRLKDEEHSGGFSMKGMLRAFESTPAENRDRQRRRVERRYGAVEQCSEDIKAKKAALLQALQRRDAAVEGAAGAVQAMEARRLLHTKQALSDMVALERAVCERRLQQLAQLEAEVARVDCQADLAAYVAAERERPRDAGAGADGGSSGGGTFGGPPVKYGKALELLDEYHQLRVSNALQEEASGYVDMLAPELHSASVSGDDADPAAAARVVAPSGVRSIGDYFDRVAANGHATTSTAAAAAAAAAPSSSSALASSSTDSQHAATAAAAFAAATAGIDVHARHSWEAVFAKVDALAQKTAAAAARSSAAAAASSSSSSLSYDALDDGPPPPPPPTPPPPLTMSFPTNSHSSSSGGRPASSSSSASTSTSTSSRPGALQRSVDSFPADRISHSPGRAAAAAATAASASQLAEVAHLLTRIFDTTHFGPPGQQANAVSAREYEEICVSLLGMFFSRDARTYFLQQLDVKRGRQSALRPDRQRVLVRAFRAFLDCCVVPDDVQAAMRVANMANTFHATTGDDTASGSGGSGNSGAAKKVLCIEGVREHPIFGAEGFWDEALNAGVSAQMLNWASEPVLWDELEADALHGAVVAVHNIIFGQLATISFTMREVGLSEAEVVARVLEMSRECELSEEQELQLVETIRGYRRSSTLL